MKLIIDIPEKIYELCQRDVCREPGRNGKTLYRTVWEAIAKGKPADKDYISRESIRQKLQKHHDLFVKAYGGYIPWNEKIRVDEISNCIAMVVNEPSVYPERPKKE